MSSANPQTEPIPGDRETRNGTTIVRLEDAAGDTFYALYNPARDRKPSSGTATSSPQPEGDSEGTLACPFCDRENLHGQGAERQGARMLVARNRYPILEEHLLIVDDDPKTRFSHEKARYYFLPSATIGEFSGAVPDRWAQGTGFHNVVDTGASQPHPHAQVLTQFEAPLFRRSVVGTEFSIGGTQVMRVLDWPITALRLTMPRRTLVRVFDTLIHAVAGAAPPHLPPSLLFSGPHMYVVPRQHKAIQALAPYKSGSLGASEVGGILQLQANETTLVDTTERAGQRRVLNAYFDDLRRVAYPDPNLWLRGFEDSLAAASPPEG